jgi:hypothetical protein
VCKLGNPGLAEEAPIELDAAEELVATAAVVDEAFETRVDTKIAII